MHHIDFAQLFYQYNPWWLSPASFSTSIGRPTLLRNLLSLVENPDVLMLTGLRRVGKTTLMKNMIQTLLLENRVSATHCFYISMDDYQLKNISITQLIDEYRKIHKLSFYEKVYIFLDEITYAEDFQIQLKNLYDKGHVKCIVSSSSSSLLKDDSAFLTGRKRIIEINPLSFEEFLLFKNIKISPADNHLIDEYFESYMKTGGIPEYVLRGDREYLINLMDDIITKDIIAKHGIRQPHIIKEFFILLMERAGKQISLNKIAHILNISADTAKRYLTLFEDTYLIHIVSRFGKTNEILLSPKKIYATDLGLRNAVVGFRDKGAIFENLIYMAIKKYSPKYFYQNQNELDFVFKNILIEVKYHAELSDKQKELFDSVNIKHKFIVRNYLELQEVMEELADLDRESI